MRYEEDEDHALVALADASETHRVIQASLKVPMDRWDNNEAFYIIKRWSLGIL